jgi:hypothetical protein
MREKAGGSGTGHGFGISHPVNPHPLPRLVNPTWGQTVTCSVVRPTCNTLDLWVYSASSTGLRDHVDRFGQS